MEKTMINNGPRKSDYEKYIQEGIGYQQYWKNMAEDLALNTDPKTREYIHLNQRRMHRVEKTYAPGAALLERLKNLRHKTWWLVLTEHWCGDASQVLPVLNHIAGLSNGKIELRLVYRDQHPELMNAWLTEGARAIPKLLQLDMHFNIIGFWGPRPKEAQALVKQLRSDPATATGYGEQLHLWYAKNRQQALETDISQLLYRVSLYCADCFS